jgi:serine/threonine-protein kinase
VLVVVLIAIALGEPAWRLLDGPGTGSAREPHVAAPRRSAAAPPVVGADRQAAAAPTSGASSPSSPSAPSSQASSQAQIQVGATGGTRRPVEVTAYGPWQCADVYQWAVGHPVVAKPCHAVGGGVRILGHMQALPGVQADISVTLLDAATGETIMGPYDCDGVFFTDFAPEHDCGPFELRPPHGRRYVVVEKWQYTGRAYLPTGEVRGVVFDW